MRHIQIKELNQLRSLSQRIIQTDLQALDIKHLAEFEYTYRKRCQLSIALYKNWLKEYKQETDSMQLLYGSIEGMMLRAQAMDAVRLYWIIRQDFRAVFKSYLGKVTSYSRFKQAA